jgi:hypothetical protein
MSFLEEIPGYREALAAEREARDYAFLGLPAAICGIDVVLLTLRQLVARLAISCPFISGRPAEKIMQLPDPAGEIAAFIWHVSIARARSCGNPLAEYRARQVFYARLAFISAEDAMAGIQEYLKTTFMDSPATGGKESVPTASVAATLIDIFAAEYGWTRDEILDAPLVQLYQLLRERARTLNPKAILFNRLSDKVRGDYLAPINEAAIAAAAAARETLP